MNEYLFDLLILVVIVCATLITKYIIPWLKAQVKDTVYEEIFTEVGNAVRHAEMVVLGEKQGKAKKAQVLAYMSHWLTEKGITISEEQLNILIESAVYSMKKESL